MDVVGKNESGCRQPDSVSLREVGYHIAVEGIEHENVHAVPANQPVGPGAALKHVGPVPARKRVGPGAARKRVGPGAAINAVRARPACGGVAAAHAGNRVVAVAAGQSFAIRRADD